MTLSQEYEEKAKEIVEEFAGCANCCGGQGAVATENAVASALLAADRAGAQRVIRAIEQSSTYEALSDNQTVKELYNAARRAVGE